MGYGGAQAPRPRSRYTKPPPRWPSPPTPFDTCDVPFEFLFISVELTNETLGYCTPPSVAGGATSFLRSICRGAIFVGIYTGNL